MEQKNLVAESIWIVYFLYSVFSVILDGVNNERYSSKSYLIFNIVREFLQISDENKIKSCLKQIASKLEELVSCSNLWKINLNRSNDNLIICTSSCEEVDYLIKKILELIFFDK